MSNLVTRLIKHILFVSILAVTGDNDSFVHDEDGTLLFDGFKANGNLVALASNNIP
ncbi:unnamed protein product, partial [Didymodactylos carnosus]